MITIVDYGMGNLSSIKNMIKKIGGKAEITSDPRVIEQSTKIILPGVGAFDNAMENIRSLGLLEVLNTKALVERVPVHGICLGMQIMLESSEEGKLKGLGWISGSVKRFNIPASSNLKIPHMGWNVVYPKNNTTIFKNLENLRFYFVHSYYVECNVKDDILATSHHGLEFVSAVQRGNITGTQFHPEKSHKYGMQLLRNFFEL